MSTNPETRTGTFAGLHPMSRTAGVSTSDYTAVNVACVCALVIGLSSVLSLLTNVLLIVPMIALICGVIGIVQVSRSEGTQTGRPLAVLGMVAAIGISAFSFAEQSAEAAATRGDREAIRQLVAEFEKHIRAKAYDQAYALFNTRFQRTMSAENFARGIQWQEERTGGIQGFALGEVIGVRRDELTGAATAASMLSIISARTPADAPDRRGISFQLEDGQWRINEIVQWF